jgi:hypothetical protein
MHECGIDITGDPGHLDVEGNPRSATGSSSGSAHCSASQPVLGRQDQRSNRRSCCRSHGGPRPWSWDVDFSPSPRRHAVFCARGLASINPGEISRLTVALNRLTA